MSNVPIFQGLEFLGVGGGNEEIFVYYLAWGSKTFKKLKIHLRNLNSSLRKKETKILSIFVNGGHFGGHFGGHLWCLKFKFSDFSKITLIPVKNVF